MSTRIISATLVSAALLGSCSSPSDVGPGQCHPCTVSAKVGPLLKQAQQMIATNDYQGATVKLDQAEAVKFTPDDEKVITQMRRAVRIMQAQHPDQPQP